MPLRTVTPPSIEPVDVSDAMLFCRAPSDDAPMLLVMIKAARERAEHLTQRLFVQRTMEWTGPAFSDGPAWEPTSWTPSCDWSRAKLSGPPGGRPYGRFVELVAPVQSIVSVKYLDVDAVEQTLSAGYRLDSVNEPARLYFDPSITLPVLAPGREDAVRVSFLAGYPPDGADPPNYRANLPGALLQWMQVQVSTWYTKRESIETGRLVEASRNYIDGVLDGLIVSTRFA